MKLHIPNNAANSFLTLSRGHKKISETYADGFAFVIAKALSQTVKNNI
jgi:hypothetical protein